MVIPIIMIIVGLFVFFGLFWMGYYIGDYYGSNWWFPPMIITCAVVCAILVIGGMAGVMVLVQQGGVTWI